MTDREEAVCPECPLLTIGFVSGLSGWWFKCPRCGRRWGHPQAHTLDTANDAVERARHMYREGRLA